MRTGDFPLTSSATRFWNRVIFVPVIANPNMIELQRARPLPQCLLSVQWDRRSFWAANPDGSQPQGATWRDSLESNGSRRQGNDELIPRRTPMLALPTCFITMFHRAGPCTQRNQVRRARGPYAHGFRQSSSRVSANTTRHSPCPLAARLLRIFCRSAMHSAAMENLINHVLFAAIGENPRLLAHHTQPGHRGYDRESSITLPRRITSMCDGATPNSRRGSWLLGRRHATAGGSYSQGVPSTIAGRAAIGRSAIAATLRFRVGRISSFKDDLDLIRGKHEIHAGIDLRANRHEFVGAPKHFKTASGSSAWRSAATPALPVPQTVPLLRAIPVPINATNCVLALEIPSRPLMGMTGLSEHGPDLMTAPSPKLPEDLPALRRGRLARHPIAHPQPRPCVGYDHTRNRTAHRSRITSHRQKRF